MYVRMEEVGMQNNKDEELEDCVEATSVRLLFYLTSMYSSFRSFLHISLSRSAADMTAINM